MRMGMRDDGGKCDEGGTRETGRRRRDDEAEERSEGERERPRKKGVGRGVTPEGMQRGSGCASSLFVSGLTIKLLSLT